VRVRVRVQQTQKEEEEDCSATTHGVKEVKDVCMFWGDIHMLLYPPPPSPLWLGVGGWAAAGCRGGALTVTQGCGGLGV